METELNGRESFSFGAMPSSNIPNLTKARQDLPLPDSWIGALQPLLYGMNIHGALTLLAYLNRICKKNYKYIYIYIYTYILVKVKIMVDNSNNEITTTIIDK